MLDFLEYSNSRNIKQFKQLCIMLHGYGSNSQDLFDLVPLLSPKMKNTCFIAFNTPDVCKIGSDAYGYQFAQKSLSKN